MKKLYLNLFMIVSIVSLLHADQPADSIFVDRALEDAQSSAEHCIDPDQAEWSAIRSKFKQGKILESAIAAVLFLKRRQDSILENQQLIAANQVALAKKQQIDIECLNAKFKHLQQTMMEQHRFSGG